MQQRATFTGIKWGAVFALTANMLMMAGLVLLLRQAL